MLTLAIVQRALRCNKVEVSAHAELRKVERDIPIYSILHALSCGDSNICAISQKYHPKTDRLCVDFIVNKNIYTLVFTNSLNNITVVTEYRDRFHVSNDDDHFSLGDEFRRAG
jgi:hypothetical protein